jgi:hypothetical protein
MSFRCVATQPYKIIYADGYTQELPKVWRQYRDGIWLVFQGPDTPPEPRKKPFGFCS